MNTTQRIVFTFVFRTLIFVSVFQLMHVGWLGQFAAAIILVLMSPPPEGV